MPENMGGYWGIYRQVRGGLFLSVKEGFLDDPYCVFPLCHGKQTETVLDAVHGWLNETYKTKDLVLQINVPERMTLFPMPRKEDDYFYREYTKEHH